MKNLAKLNGTKVLDKSFQKTINGGESYKKCGKHSDCPLGYCCNNLQTGICEIGPNCR